MGSSTPIPICTSPLNKFLNLDYQVVKDYLTKKKHPTITIQTITLTKYMKTPQDNISELFNHPIQDLNNSIVILKSINDKIDYIYIHKSIPNIKVRYLNQSIDLNNFIIINFRWNLRKERL